MDLLNPAKSCASRQHLSLNTEQRLSRTFGS
jgi:hypothetical protein